MPRSRKGDMAMLFTDGLYEVEARKPAALHCEMIGEAVRTPVTTFSAPGCLINAGVRSRNSRWDRKFMDDGLLVGVGKCRRKVNDQINTNAAKKNGAAMWMIPKVVSNKVRSY